MTSTADPTGLRKFLFGDCRIDEWPPDASNTEVEPWKSFVAARAAVARGATAEAESLWRSIAAMPDLESRQILQAWHFLRSIGIAPPDDTASLVLGAVAEVAVSDGHDVLAAYADGSVRYLNFSGAATVIDTPVEPVATAAAHMLEVGQSIVAAIGPWEGPLPELPDGQSRVTMLTRLGPHFGQGPDDVLRQDPMGAAFFDAATALLLAVVNLKT